jgi:hypothetical protein
MPTTGLLEFFDVGCSCCGRLSVGSLVDLALGRVVPEQLLDQVDVSEQHAAAAVAGQSKVVQRLSVGTLCQCLWQYQIIVKTVFHIPFSQTLTTIGVNQLDVFGPEVTNDLSRMLLVSRANHEIC